MNAMLQAALAQIKDTSLILEEDYKNLPAGRQGFKKAIEKILIPQRVIKGTVSITGKGGKKKTFKAFRIQHNDARVPLRVASDFIRM